MNREKLLLKVFRECLTDLNRMTLYGNIADDDVANVLDKYDWLVREIELNKFEEDKLNKEFKEWLDGQYDEEPYDTESNLVKSVKEIVEKNAKDTEEE